MALTELNTTAGSDLISLEVMSRLVPTPIQTMVFNETDFIDANSRVYENNKIKIDNKVAQIVGMRSEAKNITFEAYTGLKTVTLDRTFEVYNVDIGEWNNYDNLQKRYFEAFEQASKNGITNFNPRMMDDAWLAEFSRFMRSELLQLALKFESGVFNTIQSKHNSILSTYKWAYSDAEISNVSHDYGKIPFVVGTPWNQRKDATPISDIDAGIEKMADNEQITDLIIMGRQAARDFEHNEKEVRIMSGQFQISNPLLAPVNPIVNLTNSIMISGAGYRQVGTFRDIPIIAISKQMVVPRADGTKVTVETFDENAVSLIATRSPMNENNFLDVFGNLKFYNEDTLDEVIVTGRRWFSYHGNVSSDKKRKDYFCESKHAPLILDINALNILNVG